MYFGKEVGVWCMCLWYVRFLGDDVVGVILVGRFWYVGLFVLGYW